MKTAISIPDNIFGEADTLAGQLGISRSALYTEAIRSYLARHTDSEVTSQLDALYAGQVNTREPYSEEPPRVSRADVW